MTTWEQTEKGRNIYPKLETDLECEVLVIGGGLAGILTAYVLARAGRQVVLLEKDRLLSGATEYTTAFLTQNIDTDIAALNTVLGADKTRLIWESHRRAIREIEAIVRKERISCEFQRCSNFLYAANEKDFEELKKSHQVASDLSFLTRLQRQNDLRFRNFGYWEIPEQAKFHPLEFGRAVAAAAEKQAVQIFEQTEAVAIVGETPVRVFTKNKRRIAANWVIVATHEPFNHPRQIWLKKAMYKSYIYELSLPCGALREGIYEDLAKPYNYFRVDCRKGTDRVILGGADHRAELKIPEEKNFAALLDYFRSIYDGEFQVMNRWDGPILEPSDGLALIGEYEPRRLVATAFSGNGMTYSMIAALLFRDIIMARENPWGVLYNPRRIPRMAQLLQKGRDYTGEFAGSLKNLFRH